MKGFLLLPLFAGFILPLTANAEGNGSSIYKACIAGQKPAMKLAPNAYAQLSHLNPDYCKCFAEQVNDKRNTHLNALKICSSKVFGIEIKQKDIDKEMLNKLVKLCSDKLISIDPRYTIEAARSLCNCTMEGGYVDGLSSKQVFNKCQKYYYPNTPRMF